MTQHGLWKLPEPWTHRTRPPLLGKRTERVSHSYHRHTKSVTYVLTSKTVTHVLASRTSGRPNQSDGLEPIARRAGLKAGPYNQTRNATSKRKLL